MSEYVVRMTVEIEYMVDAKGMDDAMYKACMKLAEDVDMDKFTLSDMRVAE